MLIKGHLDQEVIDYCTQNTKSALALIFNNKINDDQCAYCFPQIEHICGIKSIHIPKGHLKKNSYFPLTMYPTHMQIKISIVSPV